MRRSIAPHPSGLPDGLFARHTEDRPMQNSAGAEPVSDLGWDSDLELGWDLDLELGLKVRASALDLDSVPDSDLV